MTPQERMKRRYQFVKTELEVEQRRRELLGADRERKRRTRKLTALWDAASVRRAEAALPPAATLIPWHLDERGCWARTVGNAG